MFHERIHTGRRAGMWPVTLMISLMLGSLALAQGEEKFKFLRRLLNYHLQGLRQTPRDDIDPSTEAKSKTVIAVIRVVDELLRGGESRVRILDVGAGPGRLPLSIFHHVAEAEGLGKEAARRVEYTGTDILERLKLVQERVSEPGKLSKNARR